jgi:hypothetical protein
MQAADEALGAGRPAAERTRFRAREFGVGERAAAVQLGEAFEVVGDAHRESPAGTDDGEL